MRRPVPVLFLDLDGTIRHGLGELDRFVNGAADVRVFDEVPGLLRRYREAGWRIVVVTNQGGIALGHMTVDDCMAAMAETERQCGRSFDQIEVCGHHPAAPRPEDAICGCRKPRSGLVFYALARLLAAFQDEAYPPHLGLLVGDRPEDRQCAEGAALPFMSAADWRAGTHLEALARGGGA